MPPDLGLTTAYRIRYDHERSTVDSAV